MNSRNPITVMDKGSLDFRSAIQRTLHILLFICGLLSNSRPTTAQASSQYFVELIGNNLKPSTEGVDTPGIVVLLNTPFPKDGVVYAFQAYFRLLETTAFQIWRPAASNSSSSGTFTLIAEISAKPSTQTEPIYIISRFMKCVRVLKGDMFGVLTISGPSAIGYVFNPFVTQALVYVPENATGSPQVGQTMVFRNVTFPYDLSCQAFYYLETQSVNLMNETTVDCPRDLSVDDVGNGITTTLIPISSGQPGLTGPEGPKGATGSVGVPGPVGLPGLPGLAGLFGTAGSTGTAGRPGDFGAIGPTGDRGDTGNSGPFIPGPMGATGPMGPEGPPGQLVPVRASQTLGYGAGNDSPSSDSDWSKQWTTELFMIGLLIWLSIISVIVLVLILCLIIITCVICAIRRHDDCTRAKVKEFHHREHDPYGSIRNTSVFETETDLSDGLANHENVDGTMSTSDYPRAPDTPTWMGAMKEDSVQEYKVWHTVE